MLKLRIMRELPLHLECDTHPVTKDNDVDHELSLQKDITPGANHLNAGGNGTRLKPGSKFCSGCIVKDLGIL